MAATALIDPRPVCWMQYAGMPDPDPINGFGCPPGYQRLAVYDTLKPEYPVSNFDLRASLVGMEKEDGPSREFTDPTTGRRWTVHNRLDIRRASKANPLKAILADLKLTATQLKATRKAAEKRLGRKVRVGFYSLPIFNIGDNVTEFRKAIRAAADAGIGDAADFLFLDAHPNSDQPLDLWTARFNENLGAMRDIFKLPVVPTILDQYAHGALTWQPVTDDTILQRYAYARQQKGVATVARMGGTKRVLQSGTWEKMAWGTHPREADISRVLGAVA